MGTSSGAGLTRAGGHSVAGAAGKARISRRLHLKNSLIVFPKQYSADGRIESVLQPSLSSPAMPGLLLPSFGSRSELPAGNQFSGATGGGGEHRC